MIKVPEDNCVELYSLEDRSVVEEENERYTFNGSTLDNKGRVLHDLTGIRIHLIDFGFDEFDRTSYDYFKDEVERCRNDIDENKILEAAVRVVGMQFLMGLDIGMVTVLRGIINNKVPLPAEFYGEVPQGMLLSIASRADDDLKKLSDGFINNGSYGDGSIIKKRGK